MSWARIARQKQLAPVGQYKPKPYRVLVYDTFAQYKLHRAAQVIRNGMDVPEFLLFCADYVLTHHRELKRFRSIFRKGKRDILAVGPEFREEALERFARWAEGER